MTRLSVVSGNIWYHLTWKMMLDIIMRVTFLPVQNKNGIWYHLTWQMMLDISS